MGFDSKKLPRHLRNVDLLTDNFTPCSYQVQLLDSALQKNVIICLSSNSGKSFIAVMAIKELSPSLSLSLDDGGKRTVLIVTKAGLIELQSNIIQHHTDLTVGNFPPEVVQSWSSEKWKTEIHKHQILVMIPQTFLHILHNNIFSLSQVNLLIFDDCHRGIDCQEYKQIMKFHDASSPHHSRILGLTTHIPGNQSNIQPEELENIISSLESTFHSSALTSNLVLSERYGNRPDEEKYVCDTFSDPTGLTEEMSYVLENSLNFLNECRIEVNEDTNSRDPRTVAKFVLSECLNILYQLGPWCCENIAQMLGNQLEKTEKHESCDIHKKFLRYSMTQMRLLTRIFEQGFTPDYNVDELLLYSTPRITQLVDVLQQFKPDYDFMIISGEDACGMELGGGDFSDSDFSDSDGEGELFDPDNKSSKLVHIAVNRNTREKETTPQRLDRISPEEDKTLCGIVFVEQQYVAFVLNKFLEEVCSWDENLCFIKSSHITGQGLKAIKDKKLITKAHKKQEETLRKFRMQELNLLISTNVLEEGVDIPRCNLVVRFDTPKDYKSYSLSKGRARAMNSKFVLLVDEEKSETFNKDLTLFKGIEKALVPPSKEKEESLEDLKNYCDLNALIPPYTPSLVEGSPKITMHSAIYIVNRYCAKLPSDAFTHLTPRCKVKQVENGSVNKCIATLALPINSPFKEEFEGDTMPTKKLAKMSVAMKMCKALHKSGELDDQLMPIGKEILKYEEDPELDEEEITGEARPGTTKRKQYYHKKVADALVGCYPTADCSCYLYLFHMILTGPITDEQNTRGRKLHAPEDSNRWFGIVSSKSIPKVPAFPVYTRSGEVTVNIRLLKTDLTFDEQQIRQLHCFHRYVFGDVLNLEKDPMEFEPSSSKIGSILVPLMEDQTGQDFYIDWEFVEKVEKSFGIKQKNIHDLEREKFNFQHDRFEDSVVMPAYRNIDQPQHFYVAEIRTDLSPLSPFPSPELYKTFSAYYLTKYGLTVSNTEQPLLDVDHTSARLNLLTPRYMNQKGVTLPTCSAETKRARRENLQQKQILIPEFCTVHLFPASFWRKAVCLAAIFYRMNYLLLAEELRKQIAIETGIGVIHIPESFNFSKLDFGFETCPEKLKENIKECNDLENETQEENITECNELVHVTQEENLNGCNELENETQKENIDKCSNLVNETQKQHIECSTLVNETQKGNTEKCSNLMNGTQKENIEEFSNHMKETHRENIEECSNPVNETQKGNIEKSSSLVNETHKENIEECSNVVNETQNENIEECSNLVNEIQTENIKQCSNVVNETRKENIEECSNLVNETQTENIKQCSNVVNETRKENIEECSNLVNETQTENIKQCSNVVNETRKENIEECSNLVNETQTENIKQCSNVVNETRKENIEECNNLMTETQKESIEKCSNIMNETQTENIEFNNLPNETQSADNEVLSLSSKNAEFNNDSSPASQEMDATLIIINSDHTSSQNDVKDINEQEYRNDSNRPPKKCGRKVDEEISSFTSDLISKSPTSSSCDIVENNCDHHHPSVGKYSPESKTRKTDVHVQTCECCNIKNEKSCESRVNNLNCAIKQHSNHIKSSLEFQCVLCASRCTKPTGTQVTKCHSPSHALEQCNLLQPSVGKSIQKLSLECCKNPSIHESSQCCKSPECNYSIECGNQSIVINTGSQISSSHQFAGVEECICKKCLVSSNDKISFIEEKTFEDTSCNIKNSPSLNSCNNLKNHLKYSPNDLVIPHSSLSLGDRVINQNTENINGAMDDKNDIKVSEDYEMVDSSLPFVKQKTDCSENKNVDCDNGLEEVSSNTGFQTNNNVSCNLTNGSSKSINGVSDIDSGANSNLSSVNNDDVYIDNLFLVDEDTDLSSYIGPNPCTVLQSLTMSNANDFFSLERLETIGDSFLKYAITVYLYCTYLGIHEGKLSYLRSKEVSNYNLYRLGKRKGLAEYMISTKFDPYENWLPPGYAVNENKRKGIVPKVVISSKNQKLPPKVENDPNPLSSSDDSSLQSDLTTEEEIQFNRELAEIQENENVDGNIDLSLSLVPYSLQTQHSIPDKSVADCVEALIGCYLTSCGRKAALLFMSWLGLKVLPHKQTASTNPHEATENCKIPQNKFGELRCPTSPLLTQTADAESKLEILLNGYEKFEEKIQYKFKDRSYLLQAFTHASYHYNRVTDCYQRLEFLGDAILDYVITRHLYEDSRKYSPGVLTDLRSALVNNNIFAALAIKWDFHKYFKAVSPALFHVIEKFVAKQKEKEDEIDIDECTDEESDEDEEELEIPKALGDIFESIAGAIYLDSGMSLATVWRVYYRMMRPQIEKYLMSIPKSPVRELLEMEPETAKFEKPERTVEGRIRVTVNVVSKGVFTGIGRNYRIAKSAAAKKALRIIKNMQAQGLVE